MDEKPEMTSIDAFAEFLADEDREQFSFQEAEELSDELKVHVSVVVKGLKAYGFAMSTREPERRVRGFQSNSHDRWYGPGACRTHGGSGWQQINGFGGDEG